MKLVKRVSKLLLVTVLLTALPLGVSAKEPDKAHIDYVALGDSLAAGITPYNGKGKGYPEFLEERFLKSQYSIDLQNFGVPGDTTVDLLGDLENPSIRAEIREAELITLDIGANDLLDALKVNDNPVIAISTVQWNLQTILYTIKQLNSNADVYVMGYYNPYPHLSVEQQAPLLPLLDALNGVIQATSVGLGYTYVPTEKMIAKRFETYLPNPQNIHLSEEGYQMVAKEFWKAIDQN